MTTHMFHIQRILSTDAPEREWKLARHYTSPDQQGSCVGLPRKHAMPADGLPEPDAAHQPHPVYIGVYLESVKPRRYYYKVVLDNRDIRGYGYASPMKAAKAYDACVTAFDLDLPGNFERDEGEQAG